MCAHAIHAPSHALRILCSASAMHCMVDTSQANNIKFTQQHSDCGIYIYGQYNVREEVCAWWNCTFVVACGQKSVQFSTHFRIIILKAHILCIEKSGRMTIARAFLLKCWRAAAAAAAMACWAAAAVADALRHYVALRAQPTPNACVCVINFMRLQIYPFLQAHMNCVWCPRVHRLFGYTYERWTYHTVLNNTHIMHTTSKTSVEWIYGWQQSEKSVLT